MTPKQLDRIAEHISDFSLAYLRGAGTGHGKAAPGMRTRSRK
jgi:hypothetical protein